MREYKRLRRICNTCDKFYTPTAKLQKNCEPCKDKIKKEFLQKRRNFLNKIKELHMKEVSK
jgi:hypothetical protein